MQCGMGIKIHTSVKERESRNRFIQSTHSFIFKTRNVFYLGNIRFHCLGIFLILNFYYYFNYVYLILIKVPKELIKEKNDSSTQMVLKPFDIKEQNKPPPKNTLKCITDLKELKL